MVDRPAAVLPRSDPPIGGLAPESQQSLLLRAVKEDWSDDKLAEELEANLARRQA